MILLENSLASTRSLWPNMVDQDQDFRLRALNAMLSTQYPSCTPVICT